ncbi:uncharacterized protein TRUGW13939_08943 [Talaromyces rugulosus]|uniref:Alpha-L-rhamnosidase n=1 Tax=Talaromyces rugulosus TaxID=121627 RepID=A0A7H8R6E4_TALRU|nr:uncharacterized protein TRUGW13939_08943 [Talaromyces rugulosus]QKX61787.1 hypothetical protein TRUGW13939_08943 [Talaromyces rugulosus]
MHIWFLAVVLLNGARAVSVELPLNKTSWQQYIVSPQSRHVVPSAIAISTGNVWNADALISGSGIARLTRAQEQYPTWPSGTTAEASSEAGPNTSGSYYAANAIDNNLTTIWNDATANQYPDVLTITSPSLVTLDGVTLESSTEGYPVNFTVETWNGSSWAVSGSITGNNETRCQVPFSQNVTTDQIRLTVTADQPSASGDYTRVVELWPGLVPLIPSVVLDFGQDVVGFLQIEFAGASTNAPGIRIAFSETLEYLTDVSDYSRSERGSGSSKLTPGSDQIAVASAPMNWTDTNGCKYNGIQVCADGLHAFRYVKISLDSISSDEPYTSNWGFVDIKSVSLNYTAYVGTPSSYSGWFECSDEQLNQFWYDASYTNEITIDTFLKDTTEPRGADSPTLDGKTVIFDGAKRDRDPYVGDIAVSGRSIYLTHQDASIAASNVLADLAQHQSSNGWIPPASINNYTLPLFDYPLWWVATSWDYILYTADTEYASTYYPNLQAVLDNWYPSMTDNSTGLLDKPTSYGDYAFLSRYGAITYDNALYVLALNNAASIATFLNLSDDATRWLQRADQVSQDVDKYLWDSEVGAYLDVATNKTRHGQDGNGLAIIAGIANGTKAQSALDYLGNKTALSYGNSFMDDNSIPGSDGSTRVYAFTSYFDIQARFLSGRADSAIDEIRRLYGCMTSQDPGTTFWEGINNGTAYEQGTTSMAHGWSTGVLPALSNYVLGLIPIAPGYQRFSINPSFPSGLSWARGQEATAYGDVYVEWTSVNDVITINFTSPNGTLADVTVPKKNSVKLDGTTVWHSSNQTKTGIEVQQGTDSISLIGVSGGQHIVVSS